MKVNAAKTILPELLGRTLYEILSEWEKTQEKAFIKAIDAAADACNDTIKQYAPVSKGKRAGTYKNSFEIDRAWQARHRYTAEWHVKEPEYRLTHLLENGHLTRDGTSRTKAIKHIKYGRQIAEKVLEEKLAGLWGG